MEQQYTSAEVRMMEARRQCEQGKHAPEPTLMAATWGMFANVPLPPLYPTDHTFECFGCDAVVTVKYPPLGRAVDAA